MFVLALGILGSSPTLACLIYLTHFFGSLIHSDARNHVRSRAREYPLPSYSPGQGNPEKWGLGTSSFLPYYAQAVSGCHQVSSLSMSTS